MIQTISKHWPIISFPEKFKIEPKLVLYLFHTGYALNIFGLWIKLNISNRSPKEGVMSESWGISYIKDENALILAYGANAKVLFMPWDLIRTNCEVLTTKATFVPMILEEHPHFTKMLNNGIYKDDRAMMEAPFSYLTKSGEIQKTTAIFYVTKSEYKTRIKLFIKSKFFNKPSKISHEINVTFKNEIGENVGKYGGGRKGGTFEITKDDKSPFHTLHRINLTKRF